MKTLLAENWVGEFGHELFAWQGYLRKLSRQYDKTVVAGRFLNKYLYSDFCSDYLPFDPNGTETDGHRLHDLTEQFHGFDGVEGDIVKAVGHYNSEDQEFIRFGKVTKNLDYDIVVHARSTNKCNTGYRNWNRENWLQLFARFPGCKVAVIGRGASAHFFFEEEDLFKNIAIKNYLDIPLEKLANIFASSKVCAGPSSGPMHFASLCGCPHVVWSAKKKETVTIMENRDRYESVWNPFQTPVTVLDHEGWQPSVHVVAKAIEKYL